MGKPPILMGIFRVDSMILTSDVVPLATEVADWGFVISIEYSSDSELQSYSEKFQNYGESWHGKIRPIIRVYPFDLKSV